MQIITIAGNIGKDAEVRRTQNGDPVAGFPVAVLRDILNYDPGTGKLFWRERKGFGERDKNFNMRFAGKEAFTSMKDGYRVGAILNRNYRAHRVIFAIMTGRWPEGHIDHINGDRSDNRWENLRDVSVSQNQRNASISRNNTSGCVGVYWDAKRGKWAAQIAADGRNNFLGYYLEKFDAVLARANAERHYKFHANHGRKA